MEPKMPQRESLGTKKEFPLKGINRTNNLMCDRNVFNIRFWIIRKFCSL